MRFAMPYQKLLLSEKVRGIWFAAALSEVRYPRTSLARRDRRPQYGAVEPFSGKDQYHLFGWPLLSVLDRYL
jgi:hypothetical protein